MGPGQIRKTHLLGHSMGTIICAHIATQVPRRVKSLALLGPVAEPPEAARHAIKQRAVVARKEGMVPIADALVQASISAETRASNVGTTTMVRESIMRQDPEGYARSCEALAAAKSADFSKIACPTLLITGDEDLVATPVATISMAKKIKRSKTIILSGCGHWTPLEKPELVNNALLDFYFR